MPEDMSEFESELGDIVDPSPFHWDHAKAHHGVAVFEAMGNATEQLMLDIVDMLNEGRPALVQYLQADGTSITAAVSDPQTLHIVVKHSEDRTWLTVEPQ